MDEFQFDQLARIVARPCGRRRAIVGGMLAALVAITPGEAKKKKKKKKKPPVIPPPPPPSPPPPPPPNPSPPPPGPTFLQIEAAVHDPANNQSIFSAARQPQHPIIPAEIQVTGLDNQTRTTTIDVTFNPAKIAYVGVLNLGTGLPDGQYLVAVKFRDRVRTLRKQAPGFVTLRRGATTTLPIILTPADVNDDNVITTADYDTIVACYQDMPSSPVPAGCTNDMRKGADTDDDGWVSLFDLNLFIRVQGNN